MDDYDFPGPAAPPGSSAYYVIRFADPAQQPALVALFGWRRELIRIATQVSDAGLARIKLHWWREELERAASDTSQHPLGQRLGHAMHEHALPLASLDAMAEAIDEDLRGEAPWSREDLLAHCTRGGGSFGALLAQVGGAAPDTGRELGTAARLAEILRDLGGDLRRERCRLPGADLGAAGLLPDLDGLRDAASAEPLRRLLGELAGYLNAEGIEVADARVTPAMLAELVGLIEDGTISGKQAKEVFAEAVASGDAPGAIVEARGMKQVSDAGEIEAAVQRVLDAHPDEVASYRGGKVGLVGFFVGQVMREMRGQGNPAVVNEVVRRSLDG